MRKSLAIAVCGAVVAAFLFSASIDAQQAPAPGGIKRTVLQKSDVPGSSYEVIVALVEVPAGIKVGRHTHPGTVGAQVLEGSYTILFDGQPEKLFKAGEYLQIPAGAVHNEWPGDKPAKLLAVYTVEKGKPLASPAP